MKKLKRMSQISKDRMTAIALALWYMVAIVALIGMAYTVWSLATSRMSAQFDCEIKQIDYVRLTAEDGDGSCVFPMVSGNTSMCALPQDIHCYGAVTDFPLFKAVLQQRRG